MKTQDVVNLNEGLAAFKLKDLSVETIKNIVSLRMITKLKVARYKEMTSALMSKYEVPEIIEGTWDFADHPKAEEISKNVKAIKDEEVSLLTEGGKPFNTHFMTMDEIILASKEFTNAEGVNFLIEILLKEEDLNKRKQLEEINK